MLIMGMSFALPESGFAIVDAKSKILKAGVARIECDGVTFDRRCFDFATEIKALMVKYATRIKHVYIEHAPANKNSQVATRIGHMRGAISVSVIGGFGIEPDYINTVGIYKILKAEPSNEGKSMFAADPSKRKKGFDITDYIEVKTNYKPASTHEAMAIAVAMAGIIEQVKKGDDGVEKRQNEQQAGAS